MDLTQQETAQKIFDYLTNNGWSEEAVCGMLGNMQSESGIIADRWENDDANNLNGGYGLVQWTPATKYINWAKANGLDYQDVVSQCKRIEWEVANNQQFAYSGLTFQEFSKSKKTPEDLAQIFLVGYERPLNQNQPARQTQARYWFTQLANKKTKGEIEMQAFIKVKGGITWFDGQKRHNLPHIDCVNVLNDIYKKNNGKEMPVLDFTGSSEAWLVRLDQAINA